MKHAAVVHLVRDVQRDRLTEAQRDALAELLLAVYVALETGDEPDPEWVGVAAAMRVLLAPRSRQPRSNVVPLRPCSGRRSR